MLKNKSELRMRSGARIALVALAISGAGLAHAQVARTPIERTDPASGRNTQEEEQEASPAVVEPCKKKRGGLLGAIKRTGLAGALTNSAIGGGLGGYAAGQVANVAVDEGAKAETRSPSC